MADYSQGASVLPSLLTAYQQNQYNNGAWNTATNASHFGPFSSGGYDGIGGTFGANGTNDTSLNLGALNPAYAGFAGLSGNQLSLAQQSQYGLPSNVAAANFMTPGIAGAYGAAGSQLPGALGNANSDFAGAGNMFAAAGANPQNYANGVYQNLTAQAQPYEQQAQNNLMDKEFASGNLGSTGGGLQTTAFAQGLGQADLQRQLQAQQLATSNQQAYAGIGSQMTGAGNSLLSNAFGNFSNISGLGINNLGAQSSLSFLPANLTGAYMNNAGQAVQGANNAQQSALNMFNAGLNAQTQNSAAIARGGQLQNQLALNNAALGNSSPYGSLLNGLFSNNGGISSLFGGSGGGNSFLQNLFGTGQSGATTGAGSGVDYGSLASDSFTGASGQAAGGAGSSFGGASAGAGGGTAASATADQAALAAADPTYAAGLSDIPMGAGASAGAGSGAAAFSGASGSLGGDAAATYGADAGAAGGSSSSLGALAAAWPVAVGVGGLLGLDAIYNHNSIMSNEAAMGDLSQGLPALNAAAASPQAALARNQGYMPPGMTAADLQKGDASSAALLKWLSAQYANNNMSAEMNTNKLGLSLGKAGQSYSAGALYNTSRLRQQ